MSVCVRVCEMSTNEGVFSHRLNLRELGPLAAHMRWFVWLMDDYVCVCVRVRVRVSVSVRVCEMSTNKGVFSRRLNLRELGPLAAHMRWFVWLMDDYVYVCVRVSVCVWEWVWECVRWALIRVCFPAGSISGSSGRSPLTCAGLCGWWMIMCVCVCVWEWEWAWEWE